MMMIDSGFNLLFIVCILLSYIMFSADGFHSTFIFSLDVDEEIEIDGTHELSFFSEDLVAEQLTYMDAVSTIWFQGERKLLVFQNTASYLSGSSTDPPLQPIRLFLLGDRF